MRILNGTQNTKNKWRNIMQEHAKREPQDPIIPKDDALLLELNRLLACYQLATSDERREIWGVLNKYVPLII